MSESLEKCSEFKWCDGHGGIIEPWWHYGTIGTAASGASTVIVTALVDREPGFDYPTVLEIKLNSWEVQLNDADDEIRDLRVIADQVAGIILKARTDLNAAGVTR